ncbi:MAG TPA: aspartate-semialdehyde dehydrogenase [Gammaproteobacteria bacterium]|jgi:aspartate-semialdehyde dehydrogenase|nr:aspartate-semialdehyde dehydrogenase [Gammaproteobacteria bacterium]
MKKKMNVAIVGATGMVGTTLLSILEERKFPIDQLYLLASERSVGEVLEFNGKSIRVTSVAQFDFSQTQIAFFAASNEIAAKYAPIAAEAGNIVIDKSSHFRNVEDIPLVIPEVNKAVIQSMKKGIISSPNCSTIPIVMALKPIYDAVGIKRFNVATYQSVSGTGKDALNELANQTTHLLNAQPAHAKVYPQQIAFNVIPHCDNFLPNGYTKEEMKIVWETHKILADKTIAINPTAVRVPVFFGHSAAVHIETQKKISAADATKLLANAPSIIVSDGQFPYATPVTDAAGKDEVFVGRIREDISCENGLDLWVVSDNVRKGAALNAVQIAEVLLE